MTDGPLNTEIQGNTESCRAVSRWLKQVTDGVYDAGTSMRRSRSESESCWRGEAGDAFRNDIGGKADEADEVSDAAKQFGAGIAAFADALDTAIARMRQARGVASQGGLTVTATEILPPGPEPGPAPVAPPNGASPGWHDQYESDMRDFTAAFRDHEAKVAAFEEATETVAEAREREQEAHRNLRDALKSQVLVNLKNYGPTAVGTALSTTSAAYSAQKPLIDKIGHYTTAVEDAQATIKSSMSPGVFPQRVQAVTQASAYQKAIYDAQRSIGPKVPQPLGRVITASAGDAAIVNARIPSAAPVLKKLPYVGTGITVVTTGYGIAEGKPPAKEIEKAVVSTGGSIAIGAAAGACIGGPVGAVVGAIGGAAFSYGAGKFIDWKGGPVEQLNREVGIE